MPIAYKIDAERSVIHTAVSGLLTIEETLAYFKELQKDPGCPEEVIEIVDFTEVTDFVLRYSQMRSITQDYQSTKAAKRIQATVFLCPTELSYGVGRMLQTLHHIANEEHVVELCKTRNELKEIVERRSV